ncbi:DUF6941 family protein [Nocardia cyriacigeorgica]|uniref:Uncharacterized protein n=1 Tax=Nocardia cyriacigeorgica TaxID=135487 RepID=A0A5R8NB41_9NOCA|nr:hypothetical protein [Nocardia cyriacigeorgica]TLF72878.1 hypothetical protein FEK34_28045 [Nocardia cyriacigeorgica]
MKLNLILADAAQEAPGGKLSALGIGWTRIKQPVPQFAVVGFAEMDPIEAEQPHSLVVVLCDSDGNPIMGGPDHELLRIDAHLQGQLVNDLEKYEVVRLQFGIPVPPGIPLEPGGYEFRATIDGDLDSAAACRFRVLPTDATT